MIRLQTILVVSRGGRKLPIIGGAPRLSMDYARQLLLTHPDKYIINFVGNYPPEISSSHLVFHKINQTVNPRTRSQILYYLNAFLVDFLTTMKAIAVLLRHKEISLVHVNSNIGSIVIKTLFKRRIKLVYSLHDSYYHNSPTIKSYSKRIIKLLNNRFLETLSLKSADAIIAVSPIIAGEIKNKGNGKTFTLYPYPSLINYSKKENNNLKESFKKFFKFEDEYILSVGQQDGRKRFDRLIHGFSGLVDRRTLLVLVGDGPKHGDLVNLAFELDLKERVIFLPNLTDELLFTLFKNAKLFVLVSETEGFPIAVIESVAIGTPAMLFVPGFNPLSFGFKNTASLSLYDTMCSEDISIELNKIMKDITMSPGIVEDTIRVADEVFSFTAYGDKLHYIYENTLRKKGRKHKSNAILGKEDKTYDSS